MYNAIVFESSGILRYLVDPSVGHKVVIDVDQELVAYYRSLVPPWVDIAPQKFPSHISVVRWQKPNLTAWGRHEGESVGFGYDGSIEYDETYWGLPVHCPRASEIRVELGLEALAPWRNHFHVTIGNCKGARQG